MPANPLEMSKTPRNCLPKYSVRRPAFPAAGNCLLSEVANRSGRHSSAQATGRASIARGLLVKAGNDFRNLKGKEIATPIKRPFVKDKFGPMRPTVTNPSLMLLVGNFYNFMDVPSILSSPVSSNFYSIPHTQGCPYVNSS